MGDENVLRGGLDVLNEIKENLLELEGYKQKANDLVGEEDRLEKLISLKNKVMESEISGTVKKRQDEVRSSFDGQIDKTHARIKKVKARRDKLRNAKVSERIRFETADLREDKRSLIQDLKAVYKANRIPSIFNNKYFFSLYMPGKVIDFVIILLSIFVMLGLPVGIHVLLPDSIQGAWTMALLNISIIIICMALYIVIFKKIKTRYNKELREAKHIRDKIYFKNKRMRIIARAIKRDKDESRYGLEKYDNELSELEQMVAGIINEKKKALTVFESKTKVDITNEIKSNYENELNALKKEYDDVYEEQRGAEAKVNAFILEISRKYEAYVGKEVLSIPMIDSLIEIIESGAAATIADAMMHYRNRNSMSQME